MTWSWYSGHGEFKPYDATTSQQIQDNIERGLDSFLIYLPNGYKFTI